MRRSVVVVAAVLLVAGCARTTDGTGTVPKTPASTNHTPDFPSRPPSGSPPSQPSTSMSAPPPPTSSTPSAPSSPTRTQRDAQLTTQTGGEAHTLVPVAGGYEAASYDTAGGIRFWRVVGTEPGWRRVGVSAYPAVVGGEPYDVHVTGAMLTGMTHATFIVRGQFTTDNSGLAVAYTTGPKGWGTIKAESNGNIGPSGKPIGSDRIGLSRGFAFVHGQLQTKDCPQDLPMSSCGGHEIVKLWRWAGKDFTRAN